MRYSKINMLLDEMNDIRKLLKKERIKLKDIGVAINWYRKFHNDISKIDTNKYSDEDLLYTYTLLYSNFKSEYNKYINDYTFVCNSKTAITRLNSNTGVKLEKWIPILNWIFSILIINLFHSIIKENIQLPESNIIITNTIFKMYQESKYNDTVLLLVNDNFWIDKNETKINSYIEKYIRKTHMEEIYLSVFDYIIQQYMDDFDAKCCITPDTKISEEDKMFLGEDIYDYAMYRFNKFLLK